ncbi:hypothetical protein Tco_0264811 [Tanacetum coccineum]
MGRGPDSKDIHYSPATEDQRNRRYLKRGRKVNPLISHLYLDSAPAMEDTGSQNQKVTSLRMRMDIGISPGYVKRWIRSHPESAISKVTEKYECLTTGPEDHVKIFSSAAQVERWAMPYNGVIMFNSTLSGGRKVRFDELPPKIIDLIQGSQSILHSILHSSKKVRQVMPSKSTISSTGREGTIEEFMERFKVETGHMKGAPKCMRISGFMHGVNNPELTKRLNEHVSKTMEEMMIATTVFIRGEAVAAGKKKGHASLEGIDHLKLRFFKADVLTSQVSQKGSTDIAKIIRKPDKHGHGNGRAHKEPGECYQSIIQAPSNDVAQENITQGLSLVNPPQE